VLGGGSKRRQQYDIERAEAMLAEYRTRKATGSRKRKR